MPYPNYTNGEAVDILVDEGVDYGIRHYTSHDTFKDDETKKLWKAADEAITALIEYLQSETGRDDLS